MNEQPARVSRRSYLASTARDFDDYFRQLDDNYASLANPFAHYLALVDALRDLSAVEIRPLRRLLQPIEPDSRVIALRHDVDADPTTAVRCAHHLARVGLPGSFYLLHTAPYYGDRHGNVFVRSTPLPHWVRALIVAGCEIGLHNDAWGVESAWDRSGAESLTEELRWLRALGANIQGTVAHNSLPSYGAENYEIFEGRVLWKRRVRAPSGRKLPLGTVQESELSLTYEGTFARPREEVDVAAVEEFSALEGAGIRHEAWMRRYLLDNPYCEWQTDFQLWITGRNSWTLGGRHGDGERFEHGVDLQGALALLRELPAGSRTVIVLHPAYFRG